MNRRRNLTLLKLLVFSSMVLFLCITRSLVGVMDERFRAELSKMDTFIRPKHTDSTVSRDRTRSLNQPSNVAGTRNMDLPFKAVIDNSYPESFKHQTTTIHSPKVSKTFKQYRQNKVSHDETVYKKLSKDGSKVTSTEDNLYDVVNLDRDYTNVTYPPFVIYNPEDGPGEGGIAYYTKPNGTMEKLLQNLGLSRNSFNQFASDQISVNRRLPDGRILECKTRKFRQDLPKASVIICFHNEAWSTLLRSVHSVINRSPEHLLGEIILVDDASTQDHLHEPLYKYMSQLSKVKIVRHRKHEGLTRARLSGYSVATGPVLVFLDSHIECFPGWLEPLLDRIAEDPRNVPFPHIDQIGRESFSTAVSVHDSSYGVFDWKYLFFKWDVISERVKAKRKTPADPIRSPTMPGGLFAIDRTWFTTLGTYDPGMEYWGGENIELSFKTWMCNGSIEILPCSHVGHVFRNTNPVKWKGGGDPILSNAIRVAEVWMDEYKAIFYEQTPIPNGFSYGDVSDRQRLRSNLNCHNFKWYLDTIYPEHTLPVSLFYGEIRSLFNVDTCLDDGGKGFVVAFPCHGKGGNQKWVLTKGGRLRHYVSGDSCVNQWKILIKGCDKLAQETFNWSYNEEKMLYNVETRLCLTIDDANNLSMKPCNGRVQQRWSFTKSKFQEMG